MHDSRWRVVAVAMTVGLLLVAPASADDPLTTINDLATDTVALGTDSVADALRGCTPMVRGWSPNALRVEGPLVGSGTNGTVSYRVAGGGTAHLNCATRVKMRALVTDSSIPPHPTYSSGFTTVVTTSANPSANATVTVPYYGVDGGARPWGYITVRAEVYRRLSSGRYAPMPYGCREWHYVLQPAASLVITDPTAHGACAHGATDLLDELVGGISQQEAPRP